MRTFIRNTANRIFEISTGISIVLLTVILAAILGPMIFKGAGAVIFTDTVEFRQMQLALFNRGDTNKLNIESAQTEIIRVPLYEMLDKFKKGLDAEFLTNKSKNIYRDFSKELTDKNISGDEYVQLRAIAREIRDNLNQAFGSTNKDEINKFISIVFTYENNPKLAGTAASQFFTLAKDFQDIVGKIDLNKRTEYAKDLAAVETLLNELLGPKPNEPIPSLLMHQFGATRWDLAERLLDKIIWSEQWVEAEKGKPLQQLRIEREKIFAGTPLEPFFPYLKTNIRQILKPKLTFYWQYFIDDSTPGHYFGGIWPEIFGTLLLTLVSMIVVIPLGIISAAYLVECGGDNWVVRIIRLCINSLAGVPSIVFGLFGLAFFVLFFLPLFGMPSKPNILAASLTLSLLTLPVMIRASEEAIKSVPNTYKEASLALGAGAFRTFIKVTLPSAAPGILTGIILSLSRVAGETAPILFTGAVALGPIPNSIFDTTRTLSYGSYDMAVGDRLATLVPHNQYGMVVTLILLILCLNAIAIILRAKVYKKLQGR
jgi:phosphate transport system permease protein